MSVVSWKGQLHFQARQIKLHVCMYVCMYVCLYVVYWKGQFHFQARQIKLHVCMHFIWNANYVSNTRQNTYMLGKANYMSKNANSNLVTWFATPETSRPQQQTYMYVASWKGQFHFQARQIKLHVCMFVVYWKGQFHFQPLQIKLHVCMHFIGNANYVISCIDGGHV